jgi:cytochrome oxidase assembly protein ShyY1
MRLRFRFRTIPFIATVLLVALGILLGNWQTRRAVAKTALQTEVKQRLNGPALVLGAVPLDPAAVEYRHIIVTGEFVPTWPVFLDNRPFQGSSGFSLLMPFKIAWSGTPESGGSGADKYVLVERGWLPHGAMHNDLPQVATPRGQVRIDGIAVLRPGRVLQLGTPAPLKPGAVVQNLELQDFARASGLDLQPFVLEQLGPDAGGSDTAGLAPQRNWTVPGIDVARHRGYAFQWYGLATMAFLFFVITGFRSASKQAA